MHLSGTMMAAAPVAALSLSHRGLGPDPRAVTIG
jgi:hypothetical protein